MDSSPTLQAMKQFIVRDVEVARDWSLIAIHLGVEASVVRMATANRCELACANILEQWLSEEAGTGEKGRTWRTVLSAVEFAGHKAFSQQLKTKLFSLQ